MWYLDKDVEENIIKNMEELGYPPDAVEYAGISNAGKHKFYYGTNLLTFSKQGDFIFIGREDPVVAMLRLG